MNRTRIAAAALAAVAMFAPAPAALAADSPAPAIIASPTDPGTVTLTPEQAAQLWVAVYCPAVRAVARYDAAVARYDANDKAGDRPHVNTRIAARRAAAKLQNLADQTEAGTSDSGDWPEAIEPELDTVAETATDDVDTLADVSSRGYRWTGEEVLGFGELGEEIDTITNTLGAKCS